MKEYAIIGETKGKKKYFMGIYFKTRVMKNGNLTLDAINDLRFTTYSKPEYTVEYLEKVLVLIKEAKKHRFGGIYYSRSFNFRIVNINKKHKDFTLKPRKEGKYYIGFNALDLRPNRVK